MAVVQSHFKIRPFYETILGFRTVDNQEQNDPARRVYAGKQGKAACSQWIVQPLVSNEKKMIWLDNSSHRSYLSTQNFWLDNSGYRELSPLCRQSSTFAFNRCSIIASA
jgi:hypothetical protein